MCVCVIYFMVIYFQKVTLTDTLNLHPSNYSPASVGKKGNMGIEEGLGRSSLILQGKVSLCLGCLLIHSVAFDYQFRFRDLLEEVEHCNHMCLKMLFPERE